MRLPIAVCLSSLFAMLGCGQSGTTANSPSDPNLPIISQTLTGKAMDGQQPIAGAHIYLLAAGTVGYQKASTSLLLEASTGYSDGYGAYVLTAADGSFSIPGTYSCASSSQVYLYVLGGNGGLGMNSAIGELTDLGECPSLTTPTVTSLVVNEVTTIGAAYAMASFAVDATHVSSSGTALAEIGVANAFANAASLASLSTGTALTTIPSGSATVPQSTINTLANILAACIHSSSSSSATCTTLFSNTKAGSLVPVDTATAAINIAHNPATNVASLYALQTASSPFSPALTAAPNDFSIGLSYSTVDSGGTIGIAIDGSGNVWLDNETSAIIVLSSTGYLLSGVSGYMHNLYGPGDIAIDQSGNAWIGNYEDALPSPADPYSMVELSNSGTLLSGANGYTGGGLDSERGIAIDGSGGVWAANSGGFSVSKFSSSGVPLSGNSGFTGGSLNSPLNIAIDASGNAWVPNANGNSVTKLSNSGSILSGSTGYTDGGQGNPVGIAIDASGNAWVSYPDDQAAIYNRVVKFSNSGKVLSGPNGYTGTGVGNGYTLAIDGAGNVWAGNTYGNAVIELSNSGEVLSGANGYTNGILAFPYSIAVDGSGDVWITNESSSINRVTELVGIATPVVTPLSIGVKNNTLGTRP